MSAGRRLILICLIFAIILQSGSCKRKRSKDKRVRSKSKSKKINAEAKEDTPKKPKEAQNKDSNEPSKETAKTTAPEEEKSAEKNQETISEDSVIDEDKGSKSESQWTRHFDSLMKSKFFLKSKGYYDSIHQCGLDYFERSIEYLSVKSSEYYSVIRQNEEMRNGFLVLIYSFLFMKVFSVVCSCCTRSPQSTKNVHKALQKLKNENEQLKTKLAKLVTRVEEGSAKKESPDLGQVKESIMEEVRRMQHSANQGKRGKDEEEIFTFFHDSLRDLWSEIKSIKSKLRETDVSQLSLNFDPKMFRMDSTKKIGSQTADDNLPKASTDSVKNNLSNVLTGDVKDPLQGIKEAVEETPVKAENVDAPERVTNATKAPLVKPKIPKRRPILKKPMIKKPKSTLPRMPEPKVEPKQETEKPVPNQPESKTPQRVNSVLTEPSQPLQPQPVSNPVAGSGTQEAEIPKEDAQQTEPTDNKPERDAPENKPNENNVQTEPKKNSQAKMTPQKPMMKGPRIPKRKIPSRMPINRRVPRKPLVIKKPLKPSGPKNTAPSQGNMGI